MKYSPEQERALRVNLWSPVLADNPLNFVRYVYPWGKKGTPLEHFTGPRKWQCEELEEIGQHIAENKNRMDLGLTPQMFRKSTVSGRGVGKSALVSWIQHWFMSTRIGSTTIVTANTEPQLKSKTWPELGKWLTLALNGHWFDYQALSIRPASWFAEAVKRDLKIDAGYYYSQALTWSEDNPDAFAGTHNPLGMLVLMDEASGIAANIMSVTEGFFTEPMPNRYWFMYSNGRRNSGYFYESHHPISRDADIWRKRKLDSRTVEGTDQQVFETIIKRYGPDSDEARVEVYGQFPLEGDDQFISNGLVDAAQRRDDRKDLGAALIMGVDIARLGRDSTVIRWRQGWDARAHRPVKLHGKTMDQQEDIIGQLIDETDPDGVCIDAGNNGSGLIDNLRRRGYRIEEVWFGAAPTDKDRYDDKITECYGDLREWLGNGGCIDDDPELFHDLTAREKRYAGKQKDRLKLEPKQEYRDRGNPSPDNGDALAITFAKKFARRDRAASKNARKTSGSRRPRNVDFPLFGR